MRIFIKWLQAKVRDYFGFSAVETNGTLVLLGLMVLITFVPMAYRRLVTQPILVSEADRHALDSLISLFPQPEEMASGQSAAPISRPEPKLFLFDPNTASQSKFEALGLPSWLGERIIKYREAGGKFRIKADFKKIYGIREQDFARLEPYIQLPNSLPRSVENSNDQILGEEHNSSPRYPETRYKPLARFDANHADTTQWKRVYGIGSKLSARIVKFRDALGGFVSTQQLAEVYGLSPELLASLDTLVFIEEYYVPSQLKINLVDETELARHPYLSSRQARGLIAFRNQHGPFTAEAFSQVLVLKEEERLKLLPYLDFGVE